MYALKKLLGGLSGEKVPVGAGTFSPDTPHHIILGIHFCIYLNGKFGFALLEGEESAVCRFFSIDDAATGNCFWKFRSLIGEFTAEVNKRRRIRSPMRQ